MSYELTHTQNAHNVSKTRCGRREEYIKEFHICSKRGWKIPSFRLFTLCTHTHIYAHTHTRTHTHTHKLTLRLEHIWPHKAFMFKNKLIPFKWINLYSFLPTTCTICYRNGNWSSKKTNNLYSYTITRYFYSKISCFWSRFYDLYFQLIGIFFTNIHKFLNARNKYIFITPGHPVQNTHARQMVMVGANKHMRLKCDYQNNCFLHMSHIGGF